MNATVGSTSANMSLNIDKPKGNQNLKCTHSHKKGHSIEQCFARGCDFCKRKGHAMDNCFKYNEFLKVKGISSKANIISYDNEDLNSGFLKHSANDFSVSSEMQSAITLTREQFYSSCKP